MNRPVLPADLYPAIEALCVAPVDTGPPLWARLLAGQLAATRGHGGTSSAPASRPPVPADLLSLIDEVQRAAFHELRRAAVRPRWDVLPNGTYRRNVHAELLQVNSVLVPRYPARAISWVVQVERWVREATAILGLNVQRITLPRDATCLDCNARDVTERNGVGETVVAPAMRLLWNGPLIAGVWCAACGVQRGPADLHLMAQRLDAGIYVQ